MIGILNTDSQNIGSIQNCLEYLNFPHEMVKRENINNYSHYILPGVGSFKNVMNAIKKNYSIKEVKKILREKKIFAICVGFQIMFKTSDEGQFTGLGIFNEKVINLKKIDKSQNIPHVGFNSVYFQNKKINQNDFYFTHSYGVKYNKSFEKNETNLGFTYFGTAKILTYFETSNIIATQFHPEKSGVNGIKLIKQFYA